MASGEEEARESWALTTCRKLLVHICSGAPEGAAGSWSRPGEITELLKGRSCFLPLIIQGHQGHY